MAILQRNEPADIEHPCEGKEYIESHVVQEARKLDCNQVTKAVLSSGCSDRTLQERPRHHDRRLRAPKVYWTKFMHSESKNHLVAVIGEFIGTTMFLFFAFAGTQVANIGDTKTEPATAFNSSRLLYISICFGFSLMVNAWIFFRISGGLFNPAVTLALALVGALSIFRGLLLLFAQIGGACLASYLVSVMFPTRFNVQTTLASGTSLSQGIFIEALCTAELVFTIIMLAKEKHRATSIAPVGIGLALFIGELVAVNYTGGSLNPARSFGPAAISHTFESNHWVYWVGPFIGALLAVALYWLFKLLEYEMANPGQDGDMDNDPTKNPQHKIARIIYERQTRLKEIQAMKKAGGCTTVDGSLMDVDAVIGMPVGGFGDSDQLPNRPLSRAQDLEAQWPAAGGANRADLRKKHSKKISSQSGRGIWPRRSSTALLDKRSSRKFSIRSNK